MWASKLGLRECEDRLSRPASLAGPRVGRLELVAGAHAVAGHAHLVQLVVAEVTVALAGVFEGLW